MARFFTADLHFGHRNIIDYCRRPFRDADEMDAALVNRWNETVAADDEVVVLGDFAMGRLVDTLPLVALLHGRKVLLAGNHDRCWFGHRRGVEAGTARYLAAGFDERSGRASSTSRSPDGPCWPATSPTGVTVMTTTATSSIVRPTRVHGCSMATCTTAGGSGIG